MEKEKRLIELSIEEQEHIMKIMNDAIAQFDPRHPKLSDEANMAIRMGVNSGIEELFDIGCELAYKATLNHYKKLAKNYQDPPRTAVEDLVNSELYITIREHIKNFDGIHSLYTYFDPYVTSAFMKAKERGRGNILTKYYMDSSVTIKRARSILGSNGFTDVSSVDLSEWIRLYMNKDISALTIERIDEMDVTIESIDARPTSVSDPTSEDPAKILKNNKYEEKFKNTLGFLSDRHKMFMAAALDFTDRTGLVPTYEDAYEICKSFAPDITKDQAVRLMRGAYSEVKRHNTRYKKHRNEAPINNMRSKEDIKIMEEQEMDIEASLQDIMAFFDDNELENVAEALFDDEE